MPCRLMGPVDVGGGGGFDAILTQVRGAVCALRPGSNVLGCLNGWHPEFRTIMHRHRS